MTYHTAECSVCTRVLDRDRLVICESCGTLLCEDCWQEHEC